MEDRPGRRPQGPQRDRNGEGADAAGADGRRLPAMHIHGSLGASNEMPLLGMWTWSRSMGIADGPTEVHKITIARQVLKRYQPSEGLFPSMHLPPPRRRRAQALRRPLGARGRRACLTSGRRRTAPDGGDRASRRPARRSRAGAVDGRQRPARRGRAAPTRFVTGGASNEIFELTAASTGWRPPSTARRARGS